MESRVWQDCPIITSANQVAKTECHVPVWLLLNIVFEYFGNTLSASYTVCGTKSMNDNPMEHLKSYVTVFVMGNVDVSSLQILPKNVLGLW